ncbi:YkvA family protein [Sinanaerobacter chloroacetimidivorans]|jgi:uncharacterized membrane protein YkvA (DUF1232 family)|uniref:DUF1232 domain-containing protein n=1 Tax=Sinanaerobacter chloroacetimidivorans TaxID=2818044 RepID=A0A8J7VXX7_9FIRM|nr:DUF1232 domain-containing protein [Sinanaerobacter chloroacetimidivorans]MBR0597122.1 DUF1232 domain-containing protein [Sinanaerobacter chloroacetimidivorans]
MQFIFFQVLIKRIKAIKFFLKDKAVPKRKKIIIIAGILYLLMPIDLIPAPILLFGFVDDIVLWTFIIWYLKDELDKYWLGEVEVKPEKKYRGKKIIDDVKFEVEKEDVKEEQK